ncbi:MAG: FAD-dependent oxidoreductase, partial [Eubacteriales bacterium]
MRSIAEKRLFLFDMDGTIYLDDDVFDGTLDLLGLIKEIGGEVNRGIIVNDRMETSVPDIYAAGDCTEG